MKNTLGRMVAFGALLTGCQSGLYKVSTSEDDKTIDESVRYYEVERNSSSFAADFIKDNGASSDGILYDEERMPIEITEGRSNKEPDKPGLSGLLWMFSLGIFPMCESEYMTQEIIVKSPIGEKSGSYRIDAKRWAGWIPLFVGYPGSADERDADAKLPNSRMEGVGKDRLVKNLVGEFSFKDYVSFAKAKNGERKAEIARIKSVSEKVDGLLAKNKFDDAATLIEGESKSRSATQECDKNTWSEMRERVDVAHQAYDKKYVQGLIASGKYEDAISFCNSKNSLSADINGALRNDAVKAAVKELNDASRLIGFLKVVKEGDMRDDVVMKLKSLNSLSALTAEQLTGIANTSERDDVVLAVIEVINDKSVLASFLDKKRGTDVCKALFEKIADSDAVRSKIWDGGKEDQLLAYVSVFGSDDECLKLIKTYPNLLTDVVLKELKSKVSKTETKSAIDEMQVNRLAADIADMEGDAAVDRIQAIHDEQLKSKIAMRVLSSLVSNDGTVIGNREESRLNIDALRRRLRLNRDKSRLDKFEQLVDLLSDHDVRSWSEKILKDCESRIHFEGFYVNMPLHEYFVMKRFRKMAPSSTYAGLFSGRSHFDASFKRLVFRRTLRYKMFEKEDGEFWSAFMRKYIPSGKKKSLGEAIGDALDSGTYDYQSGYDDKLEEHCYIYKSMKYGTKVIFGEKTGTLVLEEYK